jgi:hypothetical protein
MQGPGVLRAEISCLRAGGSKERSSAGIHRQTSVSCSCYYMLAMHASWSVYMFLHVVIWPRCHSESMTYCVMNDTGTGQGPGRLSQAINLDSLIIGGMQSYGIAIGMLCITPIRGACSVFKFVVSSGDASLAQTKDIWSFCLATWALARSHNM